MKTNVKSVRKDMNRIQNLKYKLSRELPKEIFNDKKTLSSLYHSKMIADKIISSRRKFNRELDEKEALKYECLACGENYIS